MSNNKKCIRVKGTLYPKSHTKAIVYDGLTMLGDVIPNNVNTENPLADLDYVNQSVSEASATFKGTFSLSDLGISLPLPEDYLDNIEEALDATFFEEDPDSNDYCFVEIPTESGDQIARTERYKFDGQNWKYEYTINKFTDAQWDALNSGITSDKREGYDNHVSNNDIHVTTSDKSTWNAKYDKPSGGIPKTDLADAVQTSLGKADTALQEHQQLKTINNESITGSGNITIVTDTSDKADKTDVGDKTNLTTTDKSTLVAAINEVNAKATKAYDTIGQVAAFSTSENYQAGDYVIYNNKLYKFNTNHSAGAWVGTDADETTVVEQLEEFTASADGLTNKVSNFEGALEGNTSIEEFSESTTYGTDVSQVHYCYHNNLLYAATATHTGAWNAAHFEQISILETTIPVYENVIIELKTYAEGTPFDDVDVTVEVEGESDARTLTTNADGKCSTTILRGLTYTITFPHIDNYIDLETIGRQAAIAQRTIIGKYRSLTNPDTETVTVQVSYTTSGNKATSFNVVYDETDHTVNIDADTDTATFTVSEGFRYTIEMPYVEGYRTPGNVSIVAEGGNSRSIKRLYHPYIEGGIFWKMKDGGIKELGDITREDYDNDRIFGLVFDTAELQGGNSFIIPFRYLLNSYSKGNWLSAAVDVPLLIPYITTDADAISDLNGETNCRIIREYCIVNNKTSSVALATYNLVFQIDGIEKHCFTPAFGQLKLFANNRNNINTIFNNLTENNIINLSSYNWWTSGQYNATNAVRMANNTFMSYSKTDYDHWILPIISY